MKNSLSQETIKSIDKLNAIGEELKTFIFEKEEVIDLVKIALVAKRNLFILGKTGQAKSYIIENFNKRIINSKYMELLMNKMMDKDELYGRLNILDFSKGVINLITDGKIPDSDVIFLDEIFKSNEIILNTLLKTLNYEDVNLEGVMYPSKHMSVFAASNELPNFKKEEDKILYPLYNRLHLKLVTNYIEDKENFKKAIRAKRNKVAQAIQNTIDISELHALNNEVNSVVVPDEIDDLLWEIAKEIEAKGCETVSDRKLTEASILLQASALLDKRNKVELKDLSVLKYYFWENIEEIEIVKEIIKNLSENPIQNKVNAVRAMMVEQIVDANKTIDEAITSGDKTKAQKEVYKMEGIFFKMHDMYEQLLAAATTESDKKYLSDFEVFLEEEYKKILKKIGLTYVKLSEMKIRNQR